MNKKINIVGTGNVASHIALALNNCGFAINSIVGRNRQKVESLAQKIGAKPLSKASSDTENEIFIVSVSDSAIPEVISSISSNNTVLHTSGSVSIEVLSRFKNHGVFYPLYSFVADQNVRWSEVPFLFEWNNSISESVLISIAHQCDFNFHEVDSLARSRYHLSAVFSHNFVNFIIAASQEYIYQNSLDFKILVPILKQLIDNANTHQDLHQLQTGPALRGNIDILEKHLSMLDDFPIYQDVYLQMTKWIEMFHNSLKI
ncbi:MAG: DUF2520 domain-containing protein [Bacteroidales bacterium]|nr:DUF2520 domain-containing protein [Bacteroidales bacterium]